MVGDAMAGDAVKAPKTVATLSLMSLIVLVEEYAEPRNDGERDEPTVAGGTPLRLFTRAPI
jgi:hypothetical protein